MSNTTPSLDKIKALDQMLEDIAGDEYDDFSDEPNNGLESSFKRYIADEASFESIDDLH